MNQSIRERLVALAKSESLTWRYWGDRVAPRVWLTEQEWRPLTRAEQRELKRLVEDKVLTRVHGVGLWGRGPYEYRGGV